jgi:hypothetical protein
MKPKSNTPIKRKVINQKPKPRTKSRRTAEMVLIAEQRASRPIGNTYRELGGACEYWGDTV